MGLKPIMSNHACALQIAAKNGAPFPDWYDAGKEAIKTSPAPLGMHPSWRRWPMVQMSGLRSRDWRDSCPPTHLCSLDVTPHTPSVQTSNARLPHLHRAAALRMGGDQAPV
eukprot:1139727-Pelagomonas_calceolata.AAC.4